MVFGKRLLFFIFFQYFGGCFCSVWGDNFIICYLVYGDIESENEKFKKSWQFSGSIWWWLLYCRCGVLLIFVVVLQLFIFQLLFGFLNIIVKFLYFFCLVEKIDFGYEKYINLYKYFEM